MPRRRQRLTAPRRPGCDLVGNIDLIETTVVTEMTAAARHLERATKGAAGPFTEVRASGGRPDLDRHGTDITTAADRIRRLLDELTAPYETPAPGPGQDTPAT